MARNDDGAWSLLLLLAASLIVNFLFSLFSGFRHTFSAGEAASESVTTVGISIVYSFAVLCLIGQIAFRMMWPDILR